MDEPRLPERLFAPLTRLLDFRGRTRRAEFWPYLLLLAGIYLLGFVFLFMGGMRGGLLGGVMVLFLLVGLLALLAFAATVRRVHDVGWSGWWVGAYVLLTLLFIANALYSRARVLAGDQGMMMDYFPLIAGLALFQNGLGLLLLVLCVLDGTPGPNRFGPDPKGRSVTQQGRPG